MPVKRHCVFLLLLAAHGHVMAADDKPSLDLLEYLGAMETEVDGETVTPIDLDLIADNTQGEDENND